MLGLLAGTAIGMTTGSSCPDVNVCVSHAPVTIRKAIFLTLGGAVAGAYLGWLWPVHVGAPEK